MKQYNFFNSFSETSTFYNNYSIKYVQSCNNCVHTLLINSFLYLYKFLYKIRLILQNVFLLNVEHKILTFFLLLTKTKTKHHNLFKI